MIRFICGPSGSGKTELLYQKVLDASRAGGRVILLVPEQQVLSCETELARRAGTGVPLGLEVLSFRRLANTVFRAEGGLRYDYLSRGQRTVLLWRAVQSVQPALRKYGTLTARDRSFLSEVLTFIEECKASRVSAADLERAAAELTDVHSSLREKLNDFSVIYAAYNAALSAGYSDPADDLEALTGILETSDFLCDTQVYMDSFHGFTAVESEIVRLIFARAAGCTVTVLREQGEDSIMSDALTHTEAALRRAAEQSGQTVAEDIILTGTPRFESEALCYLAANLWNFSAPAFEGDTRGVTIARAHDIYAEAEYIARDIHARVRAGARYRDFAVIVRGIEGYTGILDIVFAKYGLPCFLSKRKDVTLSALIQCLLGALSVIIYGWRTDDLLAYIKTDLSGLTPDQCNLLENYVQTWGISGRRWYDEYEWNMNPAGYSEYLSDEDAELLVTLNQLRRAVCEPLVELSDAFRGDTTVEGATRALWKWIERLGLRGAVCESADPDAPQIWNCLLTALDALVRCAGEVQVSAELYRDLLLALLADADIGRIPPGCDQVTVGDASLLRLHEVQTVYAAGVLEGEFPKAVAAGAVLSDSEKRTLAALGLSLGTPDDRRSAEELLYFWKTVCAPRRDLILSYPVFTLSGGALSPSMGITRVRKLLPGVREIDCDAIPLLDRVESYENGFEIAALSRGTPLGDALMSFYEGDPAYAGRIRSLDIPLSDCQASLDAQTAREQFPSQLDLSQTRIDTFAKCEFSYHCKYLLGLREQRTPDFGSPDIGNFIHSLLERFMSRICADGKINTELPEEQIGAIVDELIDEYILHVFRDRRAVSARLSTLIGRLRRTVLLLIGNILEEFRQSAFCPAFFELPIALGPDALAPYEIALPGGGCVRMRGKIDRVDTYRDGEEVYVRVVDYKTGNKTLSVGDIEKGENLQMLLYLFAIWKTRDAAFLRKLGVKEGHVKPAGAQYYIAKAPTVRYDNLPDDPQTVLRDASDAIARSVLVLDDDTVLSALNKKRTEYSPNKLITLETFGGLLSTIEQTVSKIACRMRSGSAVAEWRGGRNECEYCKMRPVCRKGR